MKDRAEVRHADLWGLREDKYSWLGQGQVATTKWSKLEPVSPHFFFVARDVERRDEYMAGWSVRDSFCRFSTGVGTGRDRALVGFEVTSVRQLLEDLADPQLSDSAISDRYGIRDTSGWRFFGRRLDLIGRRATPDQIVPYYYRPFDMRFVLFDPIIRRDQRNLMQHLRQANLALLVCQQQAAIGFRHVLCTRHVVDESVVSSRTRERAYVGPLYVYGKKNRQEPVKRGGRAITLALFESQPEYATREPNLTPEFLAAMSSRLVLDFVPDGKGDLDSTFGPEDIFHYMYAVFHSPTYRERYAEFLKIDFPRLPLTSDLDLFRALAEKGEELVALHLMESPALDHSITRFPVKGSNEVGKVRYVEETSEVSEDLGGLDGELAPGRVYVNKTQYFQGVEREVWEFHIGGYQVLHKWLKDRKGRTLSYDDVTHYGKIVVALKETMRLMEEIDEVIPSWPIE